MRGKTTAYGGLALAHKLVSSLGLARAIDSELSLFKTHRPYHESDHLLTHVYNMFVGGECIEDIASLQNSEAFRTLVGACRVPDPTTAGDFLRRFTTHDLAVVDGVLDESRRRVWERLAKGRRRLATVDLDSTIKPVYGECKMGAAFSYKKSWSYHPLLISLAETNEPLRLINRPGNAASAEGVEEALDPVLGMLKESFRKVLVRGDSAFYRRELIELCLAHGAEFALVMKSSGGLEAQAGALSEAAWDPFVSRREEERRNDAVRCRRRRLRVRRLKARRRGYLTLSTTAEWVAEMRYRPTGMKRDFRVVIKRQLIREERQAEMFERYEYRFLITSLEDRPAAEVVRLAYGRCAQENTIEQLKNGIAAMRMPTGELVANGAFMTAALIAWSLKSWLTLLALPVEALAWEWKRFRQSFVHVAAKIIAQSRQVVARLAVSHRFTGQMLAASDRLDALAFR